MPGCESCGFGGRDILPYLLVSPQTLHPYVYVSNNPLNYIDPLGLCCVPKSVCEENRLKCMDNAKQEGVKCLLGVGTNALPGIGGELIASGAFGSIGGYVYGLIELYSIGWQVEQCKKYTEGLEASCQTAYENCMSKCK